MSTVQETPSRPPSAGQRATPGEVVISFQDVRLSFGTDRVLRGVSFEVRHGETKVMLGEAGTGKTVLLKLTLGLLRPDSGRIFVLGQEVTRMSEEELFDLRRRIGIVFQESALFDSLSVRENVAYRLIEERQADEVEIEKRVRTVLEFVELADAIDKMPADLSGGMRRRVSIARALATEPEVMLYDSPTGGLDPVTSTTIMELIIRLRDVNRETALLVTHRLQDGFLMATHGWDSANNRLQPVPPEQSNTSFLLLRDGKIVFDGSAHDLVSSHDSYIQTYLK